LPPHSLSPSFFFNDPAPPELYTLSLHDALPISLLCAGQPGAVRLELGEGLGRAGQGLHLGLQLGHPLRGPLVLGLRRLALGDDADRKSTRLNSSHSQISYAVFCLKKKKKHYESP